MTDVLIFLTGLTIGAMNAVAGGGMLIGYPALVALGVPPIVANVTGNLITAPGQIASAWGYRKYLRQVPKRFLWLLIPLTSGAIIGALTLLNTNAEQFEQLVPWLVLFGVLLFAFQPLLHFHLKQHLHGKHRTVRPLFWIGLAMLPLAFYGGYFGAGFGFMMLAFLSFAKLSDIHMMNAMKNVGAACVSTVSLICLYSSGLIDWRVGAIAATGSVIGGYAGARGSQRISTHWLRVCVIVVGLSAVVYLALMSH